MKIKQCNRNPYGLSDFAYDGEFIDKSKFSLRIPEEDVEEFLENFKNGVYKDEAERSLDYVRTSGVR